VTIHEICQQLCVSKSTLYRYLKGKDAAKRAEDTVRATDVG